MIVLLYDIGYHERVCVYHVHRIHSFIIHIHMAEETTTAPALLISVEEGMKRLLANTRIDEVMHNIKRSLDAWPMNAESTTTSHAGALASTKEEAVPFMGRITGMSSIPRAVVSNFALLHPALRDILGRHLGYILDHNLRFDSIMFPPWMIEYKEDVDTYEIWYSMQSAAAH